MHKLKKTDGKKKEKCFDDFVINEYNWLMSFSNVLLKLPSEVIWRLNSKGFQLFSRIFKVIDGYHNIKQLCLAYILYWTTVNQSRF